MSGSNRHLGGPSNAEFFRDLFSLHSNYISRNTSTTANNYPPQSAFEALEQFGREIERKEQLIREQRARERRAREERELREAENWPQQQEAITARSQWLCEHFQRHCRVRFPCCTQFYPCQLCHNISKACDNEEAEACQATHLKCSYCQHEQEVIFIFILHLNKLLNNEGLITSEPLLRKCLSGDQSSILNQNGQNCGL